MDCSNQVCRFLEDVARDCESRFCGSQADCTGDAVDIAAARSHGAVKASQRWQSAPSHHLELRLALIAASEDAATPASRNHGPSTTSIADWIAARPPVYKLFIGAILDGQLHQGDAEFFRRDCRPVRPEGIFTFESGGLQRDDGANPVVDQLLPAIGAEHDRMIRSRVISVVCHPINDLDLGKHRCAAIGLHQFETVITSGDSDQLRGRSCDEFRLPCRVSRAANSQV